MTFHFFVLATCTTRQNKQMKKWNFVFAFSRLFVLAPWPTRQNEETKKWNSISSFWRLVQRDKTNKRRNEFLFLRSRVCSCKEIVSDSSSQLILKYSDDLSWFTGVIYYFKRNVLLISAINQADEKYLKYLVIGSDVHTSVYDKRDDFGFPIVNFPWLSGDVPRLPSYGVYISQLVRFARCCTSVSDFNSKNLQLTSKLLTQGYRYHKLRKTFGKFFRSYSDLLSKFGEISFQEYVTEGISHPVFYGDLVYKLRRVRCEANFVSSGSKIVKRLRRRKYDPLIIENTIGLVLGPSTALYRSFLENYTLTNKAVGTIWRDLSKPPQRRQGPDPRPLWLLVGTPLVLGPELFDILFFITLHV